MSEQSISDLLQQGQQCFDRGDFYGAIARREEAAAQARARGDTGNELAAFADLPVAWGNIPDPEKMMEAATRLLARARELERKDYEMQAALRLAEALATPDLRNRWRELRPLLLEGLDIARQMGDTFYEIYHLLRLGGYAVRMGEDEQGYPWLQDALNALGSDVEEKGFFRAEIYRSLSDLMRQRGDFAEAMRYAEMALGAASEDGNPAYIADAQLTLARVRWVLGHPGEALRLADEVLAAARHYGWMIHELEAEQLRAELLLDMGQPQAARQAARRALEIAREMPAKEAEVKALLSLGQALTALGEQDNARHTLSLARRLSQERNYEDHFYQADALLQAWGGAGAKV